MGWDSVSPFLFVLEVGVGGCRNEITSQTMSVSRKYFSKGISHFKLSVKGGIHEGGLCRVKLILVVFSYRRVLRRGIEAQSQVVKSSLLKTTSSIVSSKRNKSFLILLVFVFYSIFN